MRSHIIPEMKDPELGTREAALHGCVDLIARMCGKPEHVVSYWLDLYFQARLAYQVEAEQRRRKLELIDRIPQVFGKAGKKGQEPQAETPAPEPEAESEATEEPVAERSVTPPPAGELTVEIGSAKGSSGDLAGFEPVEVKKGGAPLGNTSSSDAAKFKREVLARLMRMRGDGVTIESIVRASNGNLSDDIVLNILQARKIAIAYYRRLNAALDKIEGKEGAQV